MQGKEVGAAPATVQLSSSSLPSFDSSTAAQLKCEVIELVPRPKLRHSSTPPNRDSGIFEDFFPPLSSDSKEVVKQREYPHKVTLQDEEGKFSLNKSEANSSSGSDRVLHESLSSCNNSSEDDLSSLDSSEASTNLDESDSEDSDLDDSTSIDSSDLSDSTGSRPRVDRDCDQSNRSGYVSLWNENSPDVEILTNKLTVEDNFEKYFYRKSIPEFTSISDSFNFDQEDSGDESYFDFSSESFQAQVSPFNRAEAPEETYFDFNLPSPEREDGLSSPGELSRCEDGFYSNSDDEDPSDIETKMAETKVKMNDAILSNGREDLALLSLKLKQYQMHNGLIKAEQNEFSLKENNNNNNNNDNCKYSLNNETHDSTNDDSRTSSTNNKDHTQEKRELSSSGTSAESPILDAYEKECRDVPEKIAKELEKESDTKDLNEEKEERMKESKEEIEEEEASKEEMIKSEEELKNNKEFLAEQIQREIRASLAEELAVRHRPSPKQRRRERNALRRSLPQNSFHRDRHRISSPDIGEFDVYNMETAMPKIDWDAIEAHLKATNEEERRRRTDREEIRRKLAMGADEEFTLDRPLRKPSLQSRLQSGMNLQICFMNETASDCESQCSDTESTQDRVDEIEVLKEIKGLEKQGKGNDFLTHQAKLQAEAHFALAQAKDMARMQMEIEKQNQKKSPIAEIVRDSFNKIGFPFPDGKRRMTRQILTDMNVAQLQVIVNDLHTQIENLNEDLVKFLLERDDLHMEQDSMLVDIEDLTKHLGAKQKTQNGEVKSQSLPTETPVLKNCHSPLLKTKSLRLKPVPKK